MPPTRRADRSSLRCLTTCVRRWTSLRLLTQALDDDLVDADTARRYVQTMGANVRALGTLIDDLFEVSRPDGGDFVDDEGSAARPDLIHDTVTAMRA